MTMEVDANLMNVVVDRFGRDVNAAPSADGRTTTVTVPVCKSPVLYGWLATLGDDAEVLHPKTLRDGYSGWLKRIYARYGNRSGAAN